MRFQLSMQWGEMYVCACNLCNLCNIMCDLCMLIGIVKSCPTLQSIRGFLSTVDHLDQAHPEGFPEGSGSGCILCGKSFGRRDHLKNHLFYHVAKIRFAPFYYNMGRIEHFLKSKPPGVGLTDVVKTGKTASVSLIIRKY